MLGFYCVGLGVWRKGKREKMRGGVNQTWTGLGLFCVWREVESRRDLGFFL